MRIAFLTHQWPGARLGGIGAYTAHAACALAGQADVHIFTPTLPEDARAGARLPVGVKIHEISGLAERIMDGSMPSALGVAVQAGGEAMHRLALGTLLCEAVRGFDADVPFDVVEGPEYESLALPLILSNGAARCIPVVTQIHSGSAIAREVGNLAASREESLRELLELATIEGSEGVCAPSQQVLADTRVAYGRADVATGAEALPLPFDAGSVPFTPPPRGGPVLYVGRVEWLKGSHLLLEAANKFLVRHPEATLRVAGPDTMTAPTGGSMIAWMREHLSPAVRGRVAFPGEQTRAQIAAELQACSFIVTPSLRESYSYVCCEALAAGRAAIVSDQTGAAEVIGGHERAGLTFARGDVAAMAAAMSRLWGDHALRERLSRDAYDRARSVLSGDAVTARRMAFYQGVSGASQEAAAARLAKVEQMGWIRRAAAAIGRRDAAGLMECVHEWGVVKSPGMRAVEVLKRHQADRKRGGGVRFYLYGAGRHTAKLLAEKSLWEEEGHKLVGLIDDHPRFKEVPEAFGLPVQSCAGAAATLDSAEAVILSTDAFEDQFWRQTEPLRARGIGIYRLYSGTQA